MRTRLACGTLGLLLAAACGSQPASSSHHAYVVVQHMSGGTIKRSVSFTGAHISGISLMDRSGIEYQARSVTGGKVVCQVDNEPASFTECFPQNRPYWALFIASGGRWSSAPGGVSDVSLHDGEALGWHYVPAGDPTPSPPPLPV
jgi:hypothetical protein